MSTTNESMTSDAAKVRMQMIHIILLGSEAQRRLRSSADIADIEARMASIGKSVPTDEEMVAKLLRAEEMLGELDAVRLTPEGKRVYRDLYKRFKIERDARGL